MSDVQTTDAFEWLAAMLRVRSGLVLGADKLYLLETRLQPLLAREGLADLDQLTFRLKTQGQEDLGQEVVELMTTNETLFFRDAKPFAHFAACGLPQAAAARPPGQAVRIWSAGASCGQEAYSMAMIAAEDPALLGGRPLRILGTDISTAMLRRARTGLYTQFEVQRGLPVRRLMAHFEKREEGWQVHAPLRDVCSFAPWNLLDDPAPLGPFDIVFCRNVLIYFDDTTKRRVLAALARQLSPQGWLYLGSAETAIGLCSALEQSGTGLPIYQLAT